MNQTPTDTPTRGGFDEAMAAWVRKTCPHVIPNNTVEMFGFNVEHIPGGSSESSFLSWPDEIRVTFTATVETASGVRRRKITTDATTSDLGDFVRSLFGD